MTPSKTKRIMADCADFTAVLRQTSTGMCIVDVQRKTRGEGGNTPVKKERTSGHDLWNEARQKQQKQEDVFTFTAGSLEQARTALQQRTKFQIKWTEESTPWSGGAAGQSVEEAKAAMLKEKAERGKPVTEPIGVVLTTEEKADLRRKRAIQFMEKHREFVSDPRGFNWERMIRCAIDMGLIPNAQEPCSVAGWEQCYQYLLEHSMLIQIPNQTTPVTPYRFIKDEPEADTTRKVSLDQARRELRGVSTDDLAAQERQRREARSAARKANQPAAAEPQPEVSREDAEKMTDQQLAQLEHQRQGAVVRRRRGEGSAINIQV